MGKYPRRHPKANGDLKLYYAQWFTFACQLPTCHFKSTVENEYKQHMERVHGWIHVKANPRDDLYTPRPVPSSETHCNSTFQYYQWQLKWLEQQEKKRLSMAGKEQARVSDASPTLPSGEEEFDSISGLLGDLKVDLNKPRTLNKASHLPPDGMQVDLQNSPKRTIMQPPEDFSDAK